MKASFAHCWGQVSGTLRFTTIVCFPVLPAAPFYVASIGRGELITNCPHHITGSSGVQPADTSETQNQTWKCIKSVKNAFPFKTSVCCLTLSKREVLLQTPPHSNPLMIKLVLIHLIQNKYINSILYNPLRWKLSARQKKHHCTVLIKLVFRIIGSSEGAVN